ncbi:Biotin-requiring enzyme [Kytococcus aerolatus]|uniref:Biotin-requiring enzyme n=1 Tax=Kytococcus aerolatus TaxID=592308 RepID=A0A212THM0_9MICO|nr:biotin/lipoyl-binding carrier protein [Kytococcus aerolatus]SNC65316.1 Biotin-requiring enzyme [Kytococcus aerolatus]
MSQQIVSELVANVIAVHVEAGQRVEAGSEVALLESMKMEIPLLAEHAGTVEAVHVAPGDVVQEGDALVVLSD